MRLILAPGTFDGRIVRGRAPFTAGFTLIELLVALLVAAVLIGMVTMSGAPSPDRALRFDAERLALLLSLAREEAQVRGAPIRFESDRQGYRFVMFKGQSWRAMDDDGDLRARPWEQETRVVVERTDGMAMLEFGRDVVESPFRVQLQRGPARATIFANGLGDFEVRDEPGDGGQGAGLYAR